MISSRCGLLKFIITIQTEVINYVQLCVNVVFASSIIDKGHSMNDEFDVNFNNYLTFAIISFIFVFLFSALVLFVCFILFLYYCVLSPHIV